MKALRELSGLLDRWRWEFFALIASSCVVSAIEGICHPLLVKAIFDNVAGSRSGKTFALLIGGYLCLGLFSNLTGTANSLWNKSLDNRVVHTLSRKLLSAYYASDYASVLRNGSGYYISRIHGDLREGVLPLLLLIQSIAVQTVMLVSFSAVLCYLSWKAFAMLIALIPLSALVGKVLGKRITELTGQEREQEGAFLALMEKALSAFRMVRSFSLHPSTLRIFDERLARCLHTGYRRFKVTRLFQTLNDFTMNLSDFATMLVGALFVMRGALSFGGFLAFINTFWRALTTLMQLFNHIAELHSLAAVAQRVLAFIRSSSESKQYFTVGPFVSLSNISASYDGETPVFTNLSLQLHTAERMILVGPNGSGKTTLANILSGHFQPSQGEVMLPQRISSVTLPVIFPPLAVSELVPNSELLARLGLGEVPPDALADELSAGQQQKLALALALSQDADLYVVDEPLASLDNESRQAAIELILEMTAGKRVILIMHGYQEYYKLFDRVVTLGSLAQPAHAEAALCAE
jgi:ABC-type bacteriocin/lantibiotic exporter with double-glycine peptidase domain